MKLYLVNGQGIISKPFNTDYLLQTFYSMNKSIINQITDFIDRRGNDNFILDSGAFSLFSGTYKNMNYNYLKKYIDNYCDFVIKYKIQNFIEMDIDIMIGYETVKKINKYIGNKVGRNPLYVHHIDTRNEDDLIKACKENDYIFLGGIAKQHKSFEYLNDFVNYCFSYGSRTHLLGYTTFELDNFVKLYSIDSSSWTMGGRAGIIFNFKNNILEKIIMKDKKRISFYALNNHNLKQWIKYQQYIKNKGIITI